MAPNQLPIFRQLLHLRLEIEFFGATKSNIRTVTMRLAHASATEQQKYPLIFRLFSISLFAAAVLVAAKNYFTAPPAQRNGAKAGLRCILPTGWNCPSAPLTAAGRQIPAAPAGKYRKGMPGQTPIAAAHCLLQWQWP